MREPLVQHSCGCPESKNGPDPAIASYLRQEDSPGESTEFREPSGFYLKGISKMCSEISPSENKTCIHPKEHDGLESSGNMLAQASGPSKIVCSARSIGTLNRMSQHHLDFNIISLCCLDPDFKRGRQDHRHQTFRKSIANNQNQRI